MTDGAAVRKALHHDKTVKALSFRRVGIKSTLRFLQGVPECCLSDGCSNEHAALSRLEIMASQYTFYISGLRESGLRGGDRRCDLAQAVIRTHKYYAWGLRAVRGV
jgi:hypothetical protein